MSRPFDDSLFFGEITKRQEEIADAYDGTCEWIFGAPSQSNYLPEFPSAMQELQPLSASFLPWLRQGQDSMFWFTGKAGSDKSTLMKHVIGHPQTHKELQTWAGSMQVVLPCLFFYNPGPQLQRSLTGLMRSLMCQITDPRPELISITAGSDNYVNGDVNRPLHSHRPHE